MKITKYKHACFTVEKDDKVLVVDPGNLSTDFIAPENVVAIIITHEHADHYDFEQIEAIIDKNPEAIIIAHPDITSKIEVFQTQSVNADDSISIEPFELEFFGGEHASIYPSLPGVSNLGVLINEAIYYPGDSFTVPNKPVDVLALPVSAPWLKLSEAVDFLLAVKPRLAFPTHDALLSDIGIGMTDKMIPKITHEAGIQIQYTRISESIEI